MDGNKFYKKCMRVGRMTGCHQLPQRSFFYHGKQFPVCARCTGVFLGEGIGILLFRIGEIPIALAVLFCVVMLSDWMIQYKTGRESTNTRRFITGLLCGYAFANFLLKFVKWGAAFL